MTTAQESVLEGTRGQKVRVRQAKAQIFRQKGKYIGPESTELSPAAVSARKASSLSRRLLTSQLGRIQKKASVKQKLEDHFPGDRSARRRETQP